MTPMPFDWSRLIAEMKDESFGIPPDVTFQIEENGWLHEVKAHKMILGLVSHTFKTMFYAKDVGDKTAKVVKVEKTTVPAFQIMMDAVYNTKSIEDSLKDKSVHEVFDVVILVERYQIVELMEAAKERIANYPITDDTVLEVAGDAMEYSNMFEAEAQHLLLSCAKHLKHKLKDTTSMINYAAENEHRKEVFATLLAKMKDVVIRCSNCGRVICKDGEVIRNDEFREGLLVTNKKVGGGWKENTDWGTGRVTRVQATKVTVINVKPGITLNEFTGVQFANRSYLKTENRKPDFLFSCN